MTIKEYLHNTRLITDGAMGTYYDSIKDKEIIAEEGNLLDADRIKQIHKEYISAGARLIRTNTFATTQETDNIDDTLWIIDIACQIAHDAVSECRNEGVINETEPVFIGADIGTIIYDADKSREEQLNAYRQICSRFIDNKVDAFVFETQADTELIPELSQFIKSESDIFILVQYSFDKTGFTKGGLGISSMIKTMEAERNIDAYGFNCGMSSSHLYQALKNTGFGGNKFISALPNASYTKMIRGKTFYSNNVPYYLEMMEHLDEMGIRILGGCCGTNPEYIRALSEGLKDRKLSCLKVASQKLSLRDDARANPLKEKMDSGAKVIMVELDPPFDDDIEKVVEGAKYLSGKGTDVITLSDSPLGRSRMESALLAAKVAGESKMQVMPHLSCRDRNTIAVRGMLLGLSAFDINNLLIVTGDPVQKGDNIKQVFEMNSIKMMKYLQKMNQEVFAGREIYYGGALNYAGVNKEAIADRIRTKMEAGASYFLTQPVYSDEDIERIGYLKKSTGAKIIVGIMPLVSHKNAVFIHNEMPGINVPDEIMKQYPEGLTREEYEEVAVNVSETIIRKLGDYVDGYYFMTPFNRYQLIQRIIDRIFLL